MAEISQDVADLKAWRKVTEPILNEIAKDSKLILGKLALMEAATANHIPCPAPGMCMKLEERLRDMENWRLTVKSGGSGVAKTLVVIWSIFLGAPLSVAAIVEIVKILHP